MRRLITLGIVFSLVCSAALAADKPSKEEQEVRAAIASYTAAFNKGDAKAVAALWSENAEWISPEGKKVQGRAGIEKEMAEQFAANKGMQIEVVDPSVRLVTPDVAIEEGTAIIKYANNESEGSTYIAIHVKKDGQWKLERVRETDLPTAESSAEGLQQLAWLVGEWVDQATNSTIENRVAWTKNQSFLTLTFRVVTSEADELEGSQVIGWDPVAKTIRSWMFDSDGGFGSGVWTRRDNRWIVTFSQILPDGGRASSTNIYTQIDNDSFTWKSIHRMVDGEPQPDVPEIKVVRAAQAEPAAKTTKPATKPASKPAPAGKK